MEMKYRKLNELKKLENNPRKINDEQFKKLCESIRDNKDYFEARPLILSNRTGELVIIAGNQRYEASLKLGLLEVPTFLIENLTEEREKEIIIRDNVANGEFNWDILGNDWNPKDLYDWGLIDESNNYEQLNEEEIEIKPYTKTHILLSFPPEKLSEIEPLLKQIIDKEYIEYEQGSN